MKAIYLNMERFEMTEQMWKLRERANASIHESKKARGEDQRRLIDEAYDCDYQIESMNHSWGRFVWRAYEHIADTKIDTDEQMEITLKVNKPKFKIGDVVKYKNEQTSSKTEITITRVDVEGATVDVEDGKVKSIAVFYIYKTTRLLGDYPPDDPLAGSMLTGTVRESDLDFEVVDVT